MFTSSSSILIALFQVKYSQQVSYHFFRLFETEMCKIRAVFSKAENQLPFPFGNRQLPSALFLCSYFCGGRRTTSICAVSGPMLVTHFGDPAAM